ncbi:carbon monoxide dehydrogenase [Rhabdochromatium marinum]|uniref:carbon monoxide dehydrogenase n=1 Tax=Rhabdochromatium marinum TaxID=48729 RepID=UPI001906324E|nr:carbon monoxide dehydrogenase [Rhabdochromatium marinum]MBK1647196.1 hypothetical protein [Rhabdochromatium marinum]
MSSSQGPQRQRHGVKKKLVEGAGGLLIGAALVVFLRGLVKQRQSQGRSSADANTPEAPPSRPA